MRSGQQLAAITTPAPVTIKRNQETIHVRCKKEGFEESLVVLNSRYETRSAGNLILGGFVGIMADQASGAASKYDPQVTVYMTPLSPADAAAGAARPKPTPAPPPVGPVSAPPPPPAPAPTVFGPGPWKARTVLMADKSAGNCVGADAIYSFDLTDDKLTAVLRGNRMFTIPVPPDGAVDHSFNAFSTSNSQIVGNARTRDLELVRTAFACRWKLKPE